LRQQVLTRQFDSGLALDHLLKGIETASRIAQVCGVEAPLLAACRDTWVAAETRLGPGADHSALIRWLETLVSPAPRTQAKILAAPNGEAPERLMHRAPQRRPSASALSATPAVLVRYSTMTCPYIHGCGAQM
jgi:hypothetical protein